MNFLRNLRCHIGYKWDGTSTKDDLEVILQVNRVADDKTYAIQTEKTLDNEADSR